MFLFSFVFLSSPVANERVCVRVLKKYVLWSSLGVCTVYLFHAEGLSFNPFHPTGPFLAPKLIILIN